MTTINELTEREHEKHPNTFRHYKLTSESPSAPELVPIPAAVLDDPAGVFIHTKPVFSRMPVSNITSGM